MMQKKPLAELLNELEQEMLRLGYTEGSMKFYRRRWQMLLQRSSCALRRKIVKKVRN